jgi:hypothetical protein
MDEVVRRKKDIALRMVIKRYRYVRMRQYKIPKRCRFRL